jgi:hypothetical protein
MTARQIHDNEVVKLIDMETRGIIVNPTREKVWNNDPLSKSEETRPDDHIYVCEPNSCLGKDAIGLRFDEMPSQGELPKVVKSFVQQACRIAAILHKGGNPIVYCKNSRTRSPTVIVVFFMIFRGYSMNEFCLLFKKTYPLQRPKKNNESLEFPNFLRFLNALEFLEEALACSTKTHRNFSIIYTVRDCSKHLLGNEELLQVKTFTEGDLTKTIPIPVDDIPQGLPDSSFPPWAGIACRTTEEERKFYSATNGIQCKTRSRARAIQAIDEKKM